MKAHAAFFLAMAFGILPGGDVAADVPVIRFVASNALPPGWIVSGISSPSVPYGLVKKPGEGDGVAITFSGPQQTKGRKGEPAIESFTVYIMPTGFAGAEPPPPGPPFAPAKRLGVVEGCPVYAIWWSQILSWPDWEKNIQSYLTKKNA
jgi:hypothetical protein